MKVYEDSRLESQARFKKGELVMIRNKARKKGEVKWHGPYLVLKNHAKGVEVKLADGRNTCHITMLILNISRLWIASKGESVEKGQEAKID